MTASSNPSRAANSIFDIGLDRAVELLAQAKTGGNTVLRTLGEHPDDKAPVEICSGRYGPYARHGKVNATLPKDVTPEAVTLEEALELIAAKAAKGGTGKAKPARKPATKKATTKTKTTKEKAAAKPKTTVKKATRLKSRRSRKPPRPQRPRPRRLRRKLQPNQTRRNLLR